MEDLPLLIVASLSLWDVVGILASLDDVVVLADDSRVLSEHSELAPGELVEEVAELIAVSILLGDILSRELDLALHLLQKHEVDEHVVVRSIQLVFYSHQLEFPLQLLNTAQILNVLTCIVILDLGGLFVKYLYDTQYIEQLGLIALELTPEQIPNLKRNQIILMYFFPIGVLYDHLASFDEVMDEDAEVLDGERSEHCSHLSSYPSHLRKALNQSTTT